VHASRLAAGLPGRLVPLDELRVLLHPATTAAARNRVWAELVRRARAGDPAWVIGLTGIALPGLRHAVASLTAAYHGDPADLQSEVLITDADHTLRWIDVRPDYSTRTEPAQILAAADQLSL
jgi:hypothetical protein